MVGQFVASFIGTVVAAGFILTILDFWTLGEGRAFSNGNGSTDEVAFREETARNQNFRKYANFQKEDGVVLHHNTHELSVGNRVALSSMLTDVVNLEP